MLAIDTNVLIRILVDDPDAPDQCHKARELLAEQDLVWITQLVLVETVWVLESVYEFRKTEIINVLERISQSPSIQIKEANQFEEALALYCNHNVDFSDCLILAAAKQQQLVLHTFDRKLARLHGAQPIKMI